MFTGIVQEVGEVEEVVPVDNGARIVVRMPVLAPEVGMGDSVAINGTCLTAVELGSERIAFEAMGETMARTTTGGLVPGRPVNLEPAQTLPPGAGVMVMGREGNRLQVIGSLTGAEP